MNALDRCRSSIASRPARRATVPRLNLPLLALPTLTRAAVDAAVPGLASRASRRCCDHCRRMRGAA